MVERDEVETIIVKDLSRLGREYLQVGQYTEIYFPEKGVRFIAVNDGVDSLVESSNDFNPIRNWANELHAKDTSKKVRAIKKMQAERGERLGFVTNPNEYVHPSFRRPFHPHRLVLMSYPEVLTYEEARSFADFIRERVLRYSEHENPALPKL